MIAPLNTVYKNTALVKYAGQNLAHYLGRKMMGRFVGSLGLNLVGLWDELNSGLDDDTRVCLWTSAQEVDQLSLLWFGDIEAHMPRIACIIDARIAELYGDMRMTKPSALPEPEPELTPEPEPEPEPFALDTLEWPELNTTSPPETSPCKSKHQTMIDTIGSLGTRLTKQNLLSTALAAEIERNRQLKNELAAKNDTVVQLKNELAAKNDTIVRTLASKADWLRNELIKTDLELNAMRWS